MVFTMRCYKKWADALRFKQISRALAAGLAAAWLGLLGTASLAQTPPNSNAIEGTAVRLIRSAASEDPAKQGWDLQAEFNVTLPSRLAELARATPIYFVMDWRMTRPRWYWRDARLAQGQLFWRLSHNPITQQWRMSPASATLNNDARFAISYATLDEALAPLRRIRRDNLIQSDALDAGERYELQARLRLDTTQLPKPFQINAITNQDWAIDSGTVVSSVIAAAPVSGFVPAPSK
jgi:Domain of unknown function (DUF4390)